MKQVFKNIILLVSVLLLFGINSSYALAAVNQQELENNTPSDPMSGASSGIYKNEPVFYDLDLVDPSEVEEEGFFDGFWNTVSGDFLTDGVADAFHYAMFNFTDMLFSSNLTLTNLMLGILNFAYDADLINSLIDAVQGVIVSMTGITGNVFGSSGLYGGFLGIITLVVSIYTLYQFVVKKASITAFSSLLTSLIALTIALVFFGNYSNLIKGANTLTTQASALVLSGNANMAVDENGNIQAVSLREKMNDNIFNMMVHKPYLMLQYSTTDQNSIGDDRVLQLLKAMPFTEDREEIATKEVTEHKNNTLTFSYVTKRLNFAVLMFITNGVGSIPIYFLASSLILFQFWFLVIAMVAPFALLWSSLPNQFGVLKRYFLELSIPLILKMAVSILALVIFGLNEVIQSISTLSNGSTLGFFMSGLVQALVLLTLFILRKRIFSIFSKGSELLNNVREEMGNSFVNPLKKGVQNVATTGGALIGATVAGPQGAMLGASMGSNIAGLATGDTGPGDFARNTAQNMETMNRMLEKKKADEPTLKGQPTVGGTPEENNTSLVDKDKLTLKDGTKLAYYLEDKGLTPEMVEKTYDTLEKSDLKDITAEEMNSQYDKILNQIKQGKMKDDFSSNFAKGISSSRKQQELENEKEVLLKGSKSKGSKERTDYKYTRASLPNLGDSVPVNSLIKNRKFNLEEDPNILKNNDKQKKMNKQ